MKKYYAKVKHTEHTAEYYVWAENIDEAREKIVFMCGIPTIKVKEV